MQKKFIILALIVLIIVAGGVIVWSKKMNQEVSEKNVKEEVKIAENTNTNNVDTSDWKTYRNEEFGFEVKYPQNFELSENNEWSQLAPFFQVMFSDKTNPEKSFQVKVTLNKGMSEPLNIHLDHPVDYQDVLDNENANVFILKNGYCDGPSCSEKVIALKAEKDKKFYILEFHGANELSDSFLVNVKSSFHFIQK
jgi:hypothetical protein